MNALGAQGALLGGTALAGGTIVTLDALLWTVVRNRLKVDGAFVDSHKEGTTNTQQYAFTLSSYLFLLVHSAINTLRRLVVNNWKIILVLVIFFWGFGSLVAANQVEATKYVSVLYSTAMANGIHPTMESVVNPVMRGMFYPALSYVYVGFSYLQITTTMTTYELMAGLRNTNNIRRFFTLCASFVRSAGREGALVAGTRGEVVSFKETGATVSSFMMLVEDVGDQYCEFISPVFASIGRRSDLDSLANVIDYGLRTIVNIFPLTGWLPFWYQVRRVNDAKPLTTNTEIQEKVTLCQEICNTTAETADFARVCAFKQCNETNFMPVFTFAYMTTPFRLTIYNFQKWVGSVVDTFMYDQTRCVHNLYINTSYCEDHETGSMVLCTDVYQSTRARSVDGGERRRASAETADTVQNEARDRFSLLQLSSWRWPPWSWRSTLLFPLKAMAGGHTLSRPPFVYRPGVGAFVGNFITFSWAGVKFLFSSAFNVVYTVLPQTLQMGMITIEKAINTMLSLFQRGKFNAPLDLYQEDVLRLQSDLIKDIHDSWNWILGNRVPYIVALFYDYQLLVLQFGYRLWGLAVVFIQGANAESTANWIDYNPNEHHKVVQKINTTGLLSSSLNAWYNHRNSPWDGTCFACFDKPYTDMELLLKGVSVADIRAGVYANVTRAPDLATWNMDIETFVTVDIAGLWEEVAARASTVLLDLFFATNMEQSAATGSDERDHHTRSARRSTIRRAEDTTYIPYESSMARLTNCSSPTYADICLVETPPLNANWRVDECTAFGCRPSICGLPGDDNLPFCCDAQPYERCFSLNPHDRVSSYCHQGESTPCAPIYQLDESYGLYPRACLFDDASECCYMPTEDPTNRPRQRIPEACFASEQIGIPSYCWVQVNVSGETALLPLVQMLGTLYPTSNGTHLVNVSMESVCSPGFDYALYEHTPVDCVDRSQGRTPPACCTDGAGDLWPTDCFARDTTLRPAAPECPAPDDDDWCRLDSTRRVRDLITPVLLDTDLAFYSEDYLDQTFTVFLANTGNNSASIDTSFEKTILTEMVQIAMEILAGANEFWTSLIYWYFRVLGEMCFNIEYDIQEALGDASDLYNTIEKAVDHLNSRIQHWFADEERQILCKLVSLYSKLLYPNQGCERLTTGRRPQTFSCAVCNALDTYLTKAGQNLLKGIKALAHTLTRSHKTSRRSTDQTFIEWVIEIFEAGGWIESAVHDGLEIPARLIVKVEGEVIDNSSAHQVVSAVIESLLNIVVYLVRFFLGIWFNLWINLIKQYIWPQNAQSLAAGPRVFGVLLGVVADYVVNPLGNLISEFLWFIALIVSGPTAQRKCGTGVGCAAFTISEVTTTAENAMKTFGKTLDGDLGTIVTEFMAIMRYWFEFIIHIIVMDTKSAADSLGKLLTSTAELVAVLFKNIYTRITNDIKNFSDKVFAQIKSKIVLTTDAIITDLKDFFKCFQKKDIVPAFTCAFNLLTGKHFRRRSGPNDDMPIYWRLLADNASFDASALTEMGLQQPGGEQWVHERLMRDVLRTPEAWSSLHPCSAFVHFAAKQAWSEVDEISQVHVLRCMAYRDMQDLLTPAYIRDELPFDFAYNMWEYVIPMGINLMETAWTFFTHADVAALLDPQQTTIDDVYRAVSDTSTPRLAAYLITLARDTVYMLVQLNRENVVFMQNGVPMQDLMPEEGTRWVRRVFYSMWCEDHTTCTYDIMERVPFEEEIRRRDRRTIELETPAPPPIPTSILRSEPEGGWPSANNRILANRRDTVTDSSRTTSGDPPCSWFQRTECTLVDHIIEQLTVYSENVAHFYSRESTFAYTTARMEDVITHGIGADNKRHAWPPARHAWPGYKRLPFRQSLKDYLPDDTLDYSHKMAYELDKTDPVHGSVYDFWVWANATIPLWAKIMKDDPLYYPKKILNWATDPKGGLVDVLDRIFICKERLDWENNRRIRSPLMAAIVAFGLFWAISHFMPGGNFFIRGIGVFIGGSISFQLFLYLAYDIAFACHFNPLTTIGFVVTRTGMTIPLMANAFFSPLSVVIPPPILVNDIYDSLQNATVNERIAWAKGYVEYEDGAAATAEPSSVFNCSAKGRFDNTLYSAFWLLHEISPSLLRFVVWSDWFEFILPSHDYYERWEKQDSLDAKDRAFPSQGVAWECGKAHLLVDIAIIFTILAATLMSVLLASVMFLTSIATVLLVSETSAQLVTDVAGFRQAVPLKGGSTEDPQEISVQSGESRYGGVYVDGIRYRGRRHKADSPPPYTQGLEFGEGDYFG